MKSCQIYWIQIVNKFLLEIGRTTLLNQINFRDGTLYSTPFDVKHSLNKFFLFFGGSLRENIVSVSNPFICLF